MNRLHAFALIQRTVFDSDTIDANDVYLKLRNVIPNGGHDQVMSRDEIKGRAKEAIEQRDEAKFKVEFARHRLDILEAELRADVLDALEVIDLSNPRVCREVYDVHRQVGTSVGQPSLRQALELLKGGGHDCAALKSRLDEIYPPATDDDE